MKVLSKSVASSKTVWTGVAVALLPVLEALLGLFEAIGLGWPVVVSVIGGMIVALRWVTSQPVSIMGGDLKDVQ